MGWGALAFGSLCVIIFWLIDNIADRIIGKLDSIYNELQEINSKLEGLSDITQAIHEIRSN